ncbi:MAG: Alanine--tRNA ligase [Mycoplasmataceae bacterium]|nr:MAG: Alanine--tRNA ligase [Mycoplasmataceae bacterium]
MPKEKLESLMNNYNNSVDRIREKWLLFFQNNNHLLIEPHSLLPKDDPSLLWINSGVAALKRYFNNPELSPSKNLVNCQRVIRTNDLDRIDGNSYHQTLFEMLGCFSIGGSFKQEIIPLIWEFFTNRDLLGIDSKRLFITVLEEDKETFEIWRNQPNIFLENLILAPRSSNFWDMGDGPCGPNTEIYYCFENFTPNSALTIDDLESKKFIEIINIVFSEFYHSGSEYLPLSKKCVDIGGGLERIALVMQEVKSTFEIDLWKNSIQWLEHCLKINKINLTSEDRWKIYVIADHLRTAIFAISDGALPEHKKRGYVLKKLLKRSALLSYIFNISLDDIKILYKNIISSNGTFYKDLISNEDYILSVIENEFIKFNQSFDIAFKKINRFLENNFQPEVSADTIFFWYDTEGIPLELINFSLSKREKFFNKEKFDELLFNQKERSLLERKKQGISTFKKN